MSRRSWRRPCFRLPPQFWITHKNGEMDVGDDPVGETYWKVKNGIRLSGMPAYGKALSETQLWQVSLLLSMANKPLPAEARRRWGAKARRLSDRRQRRG